MYPTKSRNKLFRDSYPCIIEIITSGENHQNHNNKKANLLYKLKSIQRLNPGNQNNLNLNQQKKIILLKLFN